MSDFYDPSTELDALVARASALTEMGRPHDAADLLERACVDHPAAPGVFLALAYHRLRADEPQEALEAAERGIAVRDDQPVAHRLRAVALRELGRQREAVRAAEHAVALDPSSVESYLVLGAVALDRGDWKSAREAASRALELAPGDPAVLRQLAAIHRRLGDTRRATEFERAAGTPPDDRLEAAGPLAAAAPVPGLDIRAGAPDRSAAGPRRGVTALDRTIWAPSLLFAGLLTIVLALTMPTLGQKVLMLVIGLALTVAGHQVRRR